MNQKHSFNIIDYILITLWTIGFAIAGGLVTAMFIIGFHDIKTITPLIGALAILISAGIASMSVMKSIHISKLNEEKKHKKEDSKFYLDKSVQYLVYVYELFKKRPRDFMPWRDASSLLLIIKSISKNITEESHKEIFKAEYSRYSSKLSESIFKDEKDNYSPITPVFFCLDINVETTLKMAFENSQVKLNPIFIIPIFDFAEQNNNNFLENESDYENLENLDLTREKDSVLSLCAIDYINLYKEKFPTNKEQQ